MELWLASLDWRMILEIFLGVLGAPEPSIHTRH
jgi:hypothetical protein